MQYIYVPLSFSQNRVVYGVNPSFLQLHFFSFVPQKPVNIGGQYLQ